MTTQTSTTIITSTEDFLAGFEAGRAGFAAVRHCEPLNQPLTEDLIVEAIRNLTEIAVEGWLSESLLRQDAGLIAGWLSRLWNNLRD